MTVIPESYHNIAEMIDRRYEEDAEPPRPHMGVSGLGHPCDRWLWLSFRWAVQEQHSGRMLRLFKRGQDEEARIVAELRAVGLDVRKVGDEQGRVKFGSHVSGSMDGVIESGVPETPKTRHLLEIKTHNKKSFDDLEKNGVEKSKPMHWKQMQCYMHGSGLERALYVAVCKDDDRLHIERIKYDQKEAEKLIERGQRIALSDRMPEPISVDPSWYQCKMCPAWEFCHQTKQTKHVNCRTCAHATAKEDSTWRCERHDANDIPDEWQRTGCESHVLHPDLVPWQLQDGPDEWNAVYVVDGVEVVNGESGFHSAELVANPSACCNDFAKQVREVFGARVTG
jgi:hypothetical protein